jgi:membrane-associated protein
MPLNTTTIINLFVETFGYLGIGIIVFAESGLMLGIFLPGDSLLFITGLLATRGYFDITTLIIVIFIFAVAGDNLGYFIGHKLGKRIFKQKKSFIFNQENIQKTETFFTKYGKLTFIIQRFLPIIRAFAPLLAGVGKMNYKKFLFFDILGSALWSVIVTMLGFYLGSVFPSVDSYILPLVTIIIILSLIPTSIAYKKHRGRPREKEIII